VAESLKGRVWNTRGELLGMAGGWVGELPELFPPQMVKVVIDGVEREMTVEEFQAQREEIERREAAEPSRAPSYGGHEAIMAAHAKPPAPNLAYVPGPGGTFEVVDVDSGDVAGAVNDKPVPGYQLNKYEVRREQAVRKEQAELTPASQAELGRLETALTQLKAKLHALGGRP